MKLQSGFGKTMLGLSFLAWASSGATVTAWAQDKPVVMDPARARQETEAGEILARAESRMKVSAYEDAVTEFRNVLKRYPETEVRFAAQFRMADALMELKRPKEAIALLQAVVKEGSAVWSPRALIHLGDLYTSDQKYPEAFRAYRQVIRDYSDSPALDRAHFAIGSAHFRMGHFEQAAQELEQVGMAYASRVPELQRVSPGEPLQLSIQEPNIIAKADSTILATITSTAGDAESVKLRPAVEGGDLFYAAIPTTLGAAKPGDGTLQLYGADPITINYRSRYVGADAVNKTVTLPVASNARLLLRDSQGNEIRGVVVTDNFSVEITDADRDTTAGADTISLDIKTRKKDSEKVTLTETGPHTGVFVTEVKTAKADPALDSGAIETNASTLEDSATLLDDAINLIYQDEVHLRPGTKGAFAVKATLNLYNATQGEVVAVEAQLSKADLDIKSMLYKGRSLVEIASTYRDLGQEVKGADNFDKAALQFKSVITKYPNAPEVEDALFGLFQVYVAQEQYPAASGVIATITRKFPQSTRAAEALLNLATLHVKRHQYNDALGIYTTLASRGKGTPAGEAAQFAIANTYVEMLKPRAGQVLSTNVTVDQATAAFDDFIHDNPESEKAPEALLQMTRLRFGNDDFTGTVSTARRAAATFPDNEVTGRILLLQAQAQMKLRQVTDARATYANIIANYGSESEEATKQLADLDRKYPSAAPVSAAPAPAAAPAPTAPKPAAPGGSTAPKPAAPKPAAPKPAAGGKR